MIQYEVSDGIAVITIDNPPVNALGPGVLEGIEAAVARGSNDSSVKALVLIGAGETFVAGADINIFKTLTTRQQSLERSEAFHASLKNIENASKPIVAAIHGHALGGGLELAMSCHYRIALSSARVGQPEVLLGLIPGSRRHAAAAAALRRSACARDVHRRQTCAGGPRARRRHHRSSG